MLHPGRAERPLTVREYGDRWLTVYASVNFKPATLENYRRFLILHAYPTLGDLPIGTVTRSHVKALIAEKLAGGNRKGDGKPLSPWVFGGLDGGTRWITTCGCGRSGNPCWPSPGSTIGDPSSTGTPGAVCS